MVLSREVKSVRGRGGKRARHCKQKQRGMDDDDVSLVLRAG